MTLQSSPQRERDVLGVKNDWKACVKLIFESVITGWQFTDEVLVDFHDVHETIVPNDWLSGLDDFSDDMRKSQHFLDQFFCTDLVIH